MARQGGRRRSARKTPRVAGHRKQGRRPPVRGNWACALSETLALLSAAYVVFGMLVTVYLVAAILNPPRRASVRLPTPVSGQVSPEAVPAAVAVPSGDRPAAQGVTFFLSPSTVKDGWMQVRGNRDLTVVGSASGAAQVEFLLAPTGTEAADAERLLQAALVGSDGSFTMTVRLAPGTIGHARVQARTSTGDTFTSETINLLAE